MQMLHINYLVSSLEMPRSVHELKFVLQVNQGIQTILSPLRPTSGGSVHLSLSRARHLCKSLVS